MSRPKKVYVQVMQIILFGALAIFLTLIVAGPLLRTPELPMEPPRTEEPTKLPARCWYPGEGYPYPNQVMYDGKMYGQERVDALVAQAFEGADFGLDLDKVEYYCLR